MEMWTVEIFSCGSAAVQPRAVGMWTAEIFSFGKEDLATPRVMGMWTAVIIWSGSAVIHLRLLVTLIQTSFGCP